MKFKYFFFVNTLFIIFSCRTNISPKDTSIGFKPYEINLDHSFGNIKTHLLSDLCEEIDYIPLETNPSYLIQKIRQIALTDSFVFISDFNKLIQFYRNGKFIRQIGKQGRGPEEYVYIRDIGINEKKSTIIISSPMNHSVFEYDFNGKYLRSVKVPVNFGELLIIDSTSLMLHIPNVPSPGEERVLSWYIIDMNGNELIKINNSLKRKSSPGFSIIESPLYFYDGTAHFMEFGIDTLYFFKGSVKKPYAIFHLGDLKMDPDPVWSQESVEKLADRLWIYTIYEDNRYLYLNLNWGLSLEPFACVFDKNTKKVEILKDSGFLNDLNAGPSFWPKKVYSDSLLIDYIDAYQFKEYTGSSIFKNLTPKYPAAKRDLEKLADSLKETDNPVLMLVRLKK